MIARGAIHNPMIFEEFKNSYDQFDIYEEGNQEKIRLEKRELENDIEEIKPDNNPNKLNKSIDQSKNDDSKNEEDKYQQKHCKKNNKKNSNCKYEDDVQPSTNLARIFELKYQGRKFDLQTIIRDYLKFVRIII